MRVHKLLLSKELQKRYGLDLAQEIVFDVERELDYILVHHPSFDFFGYGSTVPSALEMLAEDIKITKADFESGMINRKNTHKNDYLLLKHLFKGEE